MPETLERGGAMAPELMSLTEKLAKAWKFFYKRGFVDGFGHISARVPEKDQILLSRHALTSKVSAEDFVLLDPDGKRLAGSGALPGELPIHIEIYRRRADVGSIAHFHCLFSTSFTMGERALRPVYFMASIFRSGLPVHPDSRLISNAERGSALAQTLGNCRAALLKAHGVVVTGADIEEMVAATFILEDNAHRAWITASMGELEYVSEAVMAEVEADMLKSRGAFRRIWALCEEEAGKD
jgi:ribulose-5-phosphate 4-epimerase/fuculose-1-phosphate aldolase